MINVDLLEYRTDRKYDAIVIMGVIEHLPDYEKVLDKFLTLVKPGGKIFLDGSADTKKYDQASFIVKYIYSGNHSYMVLHDFLKALAQTPLEILELFNDRDSYFHTARQWARNLDRNRDGVIARFGEFNYRRFRLYLWGTAYQFLSRGLSCYRMIIHSPGAPPSSGEHLGASILPTPASPSCSRPCSSSSSRWSSGARTTRRRTSRDELTLAAVLALLHVPCCPAGRASFSSRLRVCGWGCRGARGLPLRLGAARSGRPVLGRHPACVRSSSRSYRPNAVIVTAALSRRLFPEPCARTSERNLSLSTGVANLALTPFGALPMCHGAGGLQAQYPFGARSGAAPVILGIILLAHGRRVRPGQRRARCGVAV